MIIYMRLITYEMLVYIWYKSIMENSLSLLSILDTNKLIGFEISRLSWNKKRRLMSLMILFLRILMKKLLMRRGRLIEFTWKISILQHVWCWQTWLQIYKNNVSMYLFGSGRYLRWMESPPIMLSGCDWAPENLNLFNKS